MMHLNLRRWTVALVAIALVALGVGTPWNTAAEAGGSWSAWLYSPTTANLVHIYPDGTPEEVMLPVPAEAVSPPSSVAISPDGALLAFCVTDAEANATVYTYQLSDMTQLFTYQESNVSHCEVSRNAFIDDSSAFAVSILYNPTAGGEGLPWKIAVIETAYGDELTALHRDMDVVSAAGADTAGMYPQVTAFQKAGVPFVIFRLMPWATEGGCDLAGFAWNLSSNEVMPYEQGGSFAVDYLPPLGEVVWVESSPALPQAPFVEGPACVGNVVMYGSKATQPYIIYADAENPIMAVAFINNGQHLAVGRYVNGTMEWDALDRGGFANPLPPNMDARQLYGTMDGYVFLRQGAEGAQFVFHRIGAGPVPEESVQWQDNSGAFWQVAWVTPMQPPEGMSAFPEVVLGS